MKLRNWKCISNSEFSDDLAKISLDSGDVNAFVNLFDSEVQTIIDKDASTKVQTRLCRALVQ